MATPVKTTASLFNLIVYSPIEAKVPYFREVIQSIIERFPCRVFFITSSPSMKAVETHITTLSTGMIDCDQIEIKTPEGDTSNVIFYLLPQFIPDLPIYLMWGQDPTLDKELLPRLLPFAKRLIFDSECADEIGSLAHHILSHCSSFEHDILDMNWARSAGWRTLLKQIFDTEARVADLHHMKQISIHYNSYESSSMEHTAIQAEYLHTWIAACLKWEIKRRSQNKIVYQASNHLAEVSLHPSPKPSLNPGKIMRMDMTTKTEHYYNIECLPPSPQQVVVKVSSNETCDLPYTLPILTRAKGFTFIQELIYAPCSSHYMDMLKVIDVKRG